MKWFYAFRFGFSYDVATLLLPGYSVFLTKTHQPNKKQKTKKSKKPGRLNFWNNRLHFSSYYMCVQNYIFFPGFIAIISYGVNYSFESKIIYILLNIYLKVQKKASNTVSSAVVLFFVSSGIVYSREVNFNICLVNHNYVNYL